MSRSADRVLSFVSAEKGGEEGIEGKKALFFVVVSEADTRLPEHPLLLAFGVYWRKGD